MLSSSSPKQKSLLRLKSLGNNFLKRVPVTENNDDALRNYRFRKPELTIKKANNKVPITKKNALRIPFRKQERAKKTERTEVNKNTRSIAHNNNNTNNRVTIKRGIFPNMIRSKRIKRQLFNQKSHDNLSSSSSRSSDGMPIQRPDLMPTFSRIGHVRQSQLSSDDSSTPPIRLDAAKKKKVDVLLSDSPFLLQVNRPENVGGAGDEPLEESRPLRAALRTPENNVIEKTDHFPYTQWALSAFGNNHTITDDRQQDAFQKSRQTEVEIRKQEFEEIKLKVAQIEPLSHPKEAELIYWYEQYTECIKRVIIVERERNFPKFPDALETIKGKLHKLRTRRLEEMSRQSDGKVDIDVDYDADADMFTPKNNDGNDECVPMTVDETIKTPQLFFRTPSPLPKIQPKIDEPPRPVLDETRNKMFRTRTLQINQNAQKVFNYEREKNRGNTPQNDFRPPVMIRKVVEPTVIKTTWVASLPQENLSDFSLRGPSFNIADTIDQNAGLAGIKYLENVTNSKTDNRRAGNQHDKNWWRGVVTSAGTLRDDDRKTIDDDLPTWSQLRSLPEATTTSAEAKFDKISKRKDTRDCLPAKKPANILEVGNRDDDFRFDFATNLFDQKMTKYDRSIGDEDKALVKDGNNSKTQRPLPETTTSNTKAQFNFPHKIDKRKDTRDCLPDKRRSYSQGVGNRDDDFCFDTTANMFKKRVKQYCPFNDDDDEVEIEVQDKDNARILLPFPETTTTCTKAQFDLPRKTDKQKDTRDCLLDKRHKNFVGTKNRNEDFCPDITTNMFKERMKYYFSIDDDDDNNEKKDNSLLF